MVYYRYHYREAVVVSALQVLKYPLTMPGPASVATPPARHLPPSTYYVPSSLHAWSETMSDGRNSKLGGTFSTTSNTPMHSPLPNRPHHSPKIKLKYTNSVGSFKFHWLKNLMPIMIRYLKSVFPKAEETFLLDLLVGYVLLHVYLIIIKEMRKTLLWWDFYWTHQDGQ